MLLQLYEIACIRLYLMQGGWLMRLNFRAHAPFFIAVNKTNIIEANKWTKINLLLDTLNEKNARKGGQWSKKKLLLCYQVTLNKNKKKVENQVLNMNSTLSFDLLRLLREFSQSNRTCKKWCKWAFHYCKRRK